MGSANAASWHSLPPEIRNQILELLSNESGLACCASVSREWQAFIEPCNFSRITLTPSRLSDRESGHILNRKRNLIHYIWFCVELQSYDCTRCHSSPTEGMSDVDSQSIVDALESLFSTLCRWEARGELVLDISIYSPSDTDHWFKYVALESDDKGSPGVLTPPDDPSHGWVAGRRVMGPTENSIMRIFDEIMCEGPFESDPLEVQWWQGLPSVPAITTVLFRQQTRRRWKPQFLSLMLSRFPNLNEICYEPWREWDSFQDWNDNRYRELIECLGQRNLRKLVIFENFNEDYPRYIRECGQRVPSSAVSHALARASLQLETLSASFMIDAGYIFNEFRHISETWDNLTSLALTSRVLAPDSSNFNIDSMLLDAAAVVLKMPKLETMEIWNGREGLAMLFRYQAARKQRSAIITIRGTFELALRPNVARAWESIATQHCHSRIEIVSCVIDAAIIASHGHAICHLGLSAQVIRPVSLRQIIKEHEVRAGMLGM